MEERVFSAAAKGPIYEETVNAFRTHKDDSGIWQGEYWGKTMLSAAVVAIRPVPPRKTNGAWLLTLTRGTEQVEIPVSDFASVADADNLFSIWF